MRIQKLTDEFSRLNLQLRHDMEQAEAKVLRANELISALATTGLLKREVVLGKCRELPGDLDDDSEGTGRVLQAVLLLPKGLGMYEWISQQAFQRGQSADRKFIPFANLKAADKAFLLPFVESLLEQLLDIARIAESKRTTVSPIDAKEFFQTLRTRPRKKK